METEKLTKELEDLRKIVAVLQVQGGTNTGGDQNLHSTVNQIPILEKFSFDKSDWIRWIAHYERYRTVTLLNKADEKLQVTNLLLHMGPEVDKLLEKLDKKEDCLKTYEETKQMFNIYFQGKINIIYERAKFNLRTQQEGERASEYIEIVTKLSKSCNYGRLADELVRDRLVVGIRDQKLSEQLQLDDKLDLQKAVDKITQSEMIREQTKDLRDKIAGTAGTSNIDKVIKKKINHRREKSPKQMLHQRSKCCFRCGKAPHTFKNCPANGETCLKCKIKGHFSKMCKSKFVKSLEVDVSHQYSNSSSDSSDSVGSDFSSEAAISKIKNISHVSKPWTVNLNVLDKEVCFKIDSGADETVITTKTYRKINKNNELDLKPTSVRLMGPGESELHVRGVIKVPLTYKGIKRHVKLFVVRTSENLLGRPALEKLKIISWQTSNIDEVTGEDTSENLIKKSYLKDKYSCVFSGLGKLTDFEYTIKLKEKVDPIAVQTPRRVPLPLLETVRLELKDMVKIGVIKEINEATEWCSPMTIVKKTNGVRICTDFIELNKFVVRERYILPTVEETTAQLQDSKFFSKLDCNKGFWQLPLTKESQKYTTFITPFGRFVYQRLPFGISSGLEIFQKALSNIFLQEGLTDVLVHADDILVKGRNIIEHNKNLHKVMKVLQKYGLTLNFEKCIIGMKELKYLGVCISEKGMRPDDDSIKAIVNYAPPEDKTEVRRFLGMFTYFSKFIRDASSKSKTIRELLHERNSFVWTECHQKCFENLKQEIISAPVLANYQTNCPTRISADSSAYGIGGILEQQQKDGLWRPVYFCSKTLSDAERRYAQIEKETLSLTWTAERLEQFLLGQKFTMRTDHKPLLRILKDKPIDQLTTRLQRFRMRLMKFDFDIEYVPGKEFYCPDALSRSPLKEGQEDKDVLSTNCSIIYSINSITEKVETLSKLNTTEIGIQQENDVALKLVKTYIINGWPSKQNCSKECLLYYKFRENFALIDGILTYQDRIVIPESLRKKCLKDIHSGHFGLNKSKSRAKQTIWWPSISNHIEQKVLQCEKCLKNRKPGTEPMLCLDIPVLPWSTVGADLLEYKGKIIWLFKITTADGQKCLNSITLSQKRLFSVCRKHLQDMDRQK